MTWQEPDGPPTDTPAAGLRDVVGLVERLTRKATSVADLSTRLRQIALVVPVIWLVALLAIGSLPGSIGVAVLIVVAIVWAVCFMLVRSMESSLHSVTTGLQALTDAARSGAIGVDQLRRLPSGMMAKVQSERLSPLAVHATYRSLRSAVGTAADLRAISVAPYLLGSLALLGLGLLGACGLAVLLIGLAV